MKSSLYRFARVFSVGAVVGTLMAGWLAPKLIRWYFTPPASVPFNCEEPIVWAMSKLQITQMVGLVVGGLISSLLVFVIFRKKNIDSEMLPPA